MRLRDPAPGLDRFRRCRASVPAVEAHPARTPVKHRALTSKSCRLPIAHPERTAYSFNCIQFPKNLGADSQLDDEVSALFLPAPAQVLV
jgi:hypothetical protein